MPRPKEPRPKDPAGDPGHGGTEGCPLIAPALADLLNRPSIAAPPVSDRRPGWTCRHPGCGRRPTFARPPQ